MTNYLRKLFVAFTLALLTVMTVAVVMPESNEAETTTKVTTKTMESNGIAGVTLALNDSMVNSMKSISISKNDTGLVGASYNTTTVTSSAITENIEETVVEDEIDEPVIDEHRKDVDKTFYVSASKLNIRKEPNADSDIIDTLKCNDKIEVTEKVTVYIDGAKQPSWYKLKDQDGYVSAQYMSDDEVLECLGNFRITYYCSCPICCGKWSTTTASGATTVEGVTIAADPSIPFGTKLMINDHVYTVQDRGGAIKGNHIDIYMSSHKKALSQTYTSGPVYKIP